mgnify:CR=1 FL=1
MHSVVISGTGIYQPPHTITNAELVEAFNRYVDQENARLADEIAAGITQDTSNVIISPTEINAEGWPGDNLTGVSELLDRRVPNTRDQIVIAGKTRQVIAAAPIYVAGELVRISLRVKG